MTESTKKSTYEDAASKLGVAFLAICTVFCFVIFATVAGGVAGWVVGLVFSDQILGVLSQLGVRNVTMFQFGCFMGFCGGFLKTKVSVSN